MKKRNTVLLFILTALMCVSFISCDNPIMKEWWDDSGEEEAAPTSPTRPYTPGGWGGGGGGGAVTPPQEGEVYPVHFLDKETLEAAAEDQLVALNSKITKVPVEIEYRDSSKAFKYWAMANGIQWDFNLPLVESALTNGALTLYAEWAADPYTVEFISNNKDDPNVEDDPNDPNDPRDQKVAKGALLIEPAAGNYPGHGFAGWYKGPLISGEPTGELWNFNSPVTENMTLYAKWDIEYSTVEFYSNGGYPSPEPQTLTQDQPIRDPGLITRVGFGFGGWYQDPACTGTPWDFKTPVTESKIYLYAKWVTNSYTVMFEGNGGTPVPQAQTRPHGSKIDMPPAITKSGMAFDGWYKDSGFIEEWDFLTDTLTKSITLFAKWGTPQWTVTFDSRGGTPVPAQSVADGGTAVRPATPTKAADANSHYGTPYVFKGWYYDVNGTTAYGFDDQVFGDIDLFAFWIEHDPSMVWVEGGTFTMGGLGGTGSGTRPAHQVTVGGFYMLLVEVPQSTYDAMTWWEKRHKASPYADETAWETDYAGNYRFDSNDPNNHGLNPSRSKMSMYQPVESVTWYDAVYFCNVLTKFDNFLRPSALPWEEAYVITNIVCEGGSIPDGSIPTGTIISADVALNLNVAADPKKVGYRLPTEAEWEYAARGGSGSPGDYLWAGSGNPNDVAWYGGKSGNTTTMSEVGKKIPNSLGLCDMSGNVCEWCWDWYDSTYYRSSPASNPFGPLSSPIDERVRRGGSIRHTADNCRTQVRDSWGPNKTDNWNIGFRVVRTADE